MPIIAYPLILWGLLHLGYGAFALDAKIRCDQGNPLPGQVCPDAAEVQSKKEARLLKKEQKRLEKQAKKEERRRLKEIRKRCGPNGCKEVPAEVSAEVPGVLSFPIEAEAAQP